MNCERGDRGTGGKGKRRHGEEKIRKNERKRSIERKQNKRMINGKKRWGGREGDGGRERNGEGGRRVGFEHLVIVLEISLSKQNV